jgi:hypothetical protein
MPYNPETNRLIKAGGRTDKKLIQQYGGERSCPNGHIDHEITENGDECPICTLEMDKTEMDMYKVYPCCHTFHNGCMFTAAQAHYQTNGNWNLLCPVCRGPTLSGWMIAKTDHYYWKPE